MKVDIIVRAKNGHELLDNCVASIIENTPKDQYRLIVVDDGSDPPIKTYAEYLLRSSESRGSVSAINLGLKCSGLFDDSEYVCIMDNDTEVPEGDSGWLERFVAELETPGTGAVGATTNYASGCQHVLATPNTYTADWEDKRDGRRGTRENPQQAWFVSFCVLIPKRIIREVGLWDERFNPGNWEDTDYALRIRAAGYAVRVARSVYIRHHGHKTFGKDLPTLLRTNQEKFALKWGMGRLWDMGLVKDEEVATLVERRRELARQAAVPQP